MISILEQLLIILPLILGGYFSFSLMKIPDLGLESGFLFGAVFPICIQMLGISSEFSAGLFFLSLMGGALVGATTCLLNQIFGLPFLLSSILTNGIYHGLIQGMLGDSLISLSGMHNPLAAFSLFPGHPEFVMLCLIGVLLIGVIYFILKTQLGHAFAIYGNNPLFFNHHRQSIKYVVFSGVMMANALAGLSGYLFAQSNGFADLSMGSGIVLLCITALVIGKSLSRKQQPSLIVPLVGLIFYFAFQQLLLQIGLDLKYFNTFQALLIVGVLIFFNKKEHRLLVSDHLGV